MDELQKTTLETGVLMTSVEQSHITAGACNSQGEAPNGYVSRQEFDLLTRVVMQTKAVDLVRVGPFLNFMFVDDLAYDNISTAAKNISLKEQLLHKEAPALAMQAPENVVTNWNPFSHVLEDLVLAAFALHGAFSVIDVGCQYGSSAMETARRVAALGADAEVLAFDCGVAGELAEINIANNGFTKRIAFSRSAIGPIDGWIMMHREIYHSENNRVVNPSREGAIRSLSVPVQCTRLDTVVENCSSPDALVVKIDTQGAEPMVLAGATQFMARRKHAMLIEFTPHAIAGQVDPVEFLSMLLAEHYVFNVNAGGSQPTRINDAGVQQVVQSVASSESAYTDLLVLSHGYPPCECINDSLRRVGV